MRGLWGWCFCNCASSLKDTFCPSKRSSWSVVKAVCFYCGGRCMTRPRWIFGHPFLLRREGWKNERSWLTAGLGSGLVQSLGIKCPMCTPEPGGNRNRNAVFMGEAYDANTGFVLPKSTGLRCALLWIDVCCIFSVNAVFSLQNKLWSIAVYPSFTLALFLVSFLSLSPQIYQVQKVGLACFPSCLHAFPPCESCYNFTTTQSFRWQETPKILESNLRNPL